jgi:hypothetical protein
MEKTGMVADQIPGYDYGSPNVARSPIGEQEFEALKQSAGFTEDDEHWLRVAGETLADQTKELVGKWREVIAKHPHLARYSLRLDGQKDWHYSERSGLRFQQWVLDTCFRPYDQDWLNYQQEMALRHTSLKKNKTDNAQSAPPIHLRHIVAFGAVMTDPDIMKPFLKTDIMRMTWRRCIELGRSLFGCRLRFGQSRTPMHEKRRMNGDWN